MLAQRAAAVGLDPAPLLSASPVELVVHRLLVEQTEKAEAARLQVQARLNAREIVEQYAELKIATGEYKRKEGESRG